MVKKRAFISPGGSLRGAYTAGAASVLFEDLGSRLF